MYPGLLARHGPLASSAGNQRQTRPFQFLHHMPVYRGGQAFCPGFWQSVRKGSPDPHCMTDSALKTEPKQPKNEKILPT
jgi:hypothetical protein